MTRRVFLRLGGLTVGMVAVLAHHKPGHHGGPPTTTTTTTTLPLPSPASTDFYTDLYADAY
jgi:hypothetical protein